MVRSRTLISYIVHSQDKLVHFLRELFTRNPLIKLISDLDLPKSNSSSSWVQTRSKLELSPTWSTLSKKNLPMVFSDNAFGDRYFWFKQCVAETRTRERMEIIMKQLLPIFIIICGALRGLVTFVQFKKREKRPWRSGTLSKVTDFNLQLY